MISVPYRLVYKLIGFSPAVFGIFAAVGLEYGQFLLSQLMALTACAAAAFVWLPWLRKVCKDHQPEYLTAIRVRRLQSESVPYLFTAFLPIALLGSAHACTVTTMTLVWMIFALLCTDTEVGNPIARLLGWRFLEVMTEDGIVFVLLTTKSVQAVRSACAGELRVIRFSDSFLIDVED